MELGEQDSGSRRTVRVGDEVVVALAENATTGYRWFPEVDERALQLADDRNEAAGERIGAPGIRRLVFRVLLPGPTQLRLVKKRPWEAGPVGEFAVGLDVTT